MIFLIGMMGSGKTSIGLTLSRLLGFEHIDTDDMISIPDIMTSRNEILLRQKEYQALRRITSISDSKSYIISTGGGIILNPNCRSILQQYYNIYLKAPFKTLKERIVQQNVKRPILNNADSNFDDFQFQSLISQREKLYNFIANQTLDTKKLNIDDSAEKLKTILLKNEIIS